MIRINSGKVLSDFYFASRMKASIQVQAKFVQVESTLQWTNRLIISGPKLKPWMEEHGNRVRCVSDELVEFGTPILPDGDGGLFITLNAKQLRSKQWQEGHELFLQLSPEPSSYGIPVSEASLVTMHADPKADELFHQLPLVSSAP